MGAQDKDYEAAHKICTGKLQLIGISVFAVVVLLRGFSVVDSVLADNVLQNLVRKR